MTLERHKKIDMDINIRNYWYGYKQCMDLPSHRLKKHYVNFFDDQYLEKGHNLDDIVTNWYMEYKQSMTVNICIKCV